MKGKDRHINRLRRLASQEIVRAANRVVYAGADIIRADAHYLISRGSVSGKNHVPSAPGEPPNRDTGNLQSHLETSQPRPLVARVTSGADYAADLEFGDSTVAARPYMRPARDRKKAEVRRLFATEIDKLVKRSG